VVQRVLLVYDEAARRMRGNEAVDPAVLVRAARLVRSFAEDYHERAEERFVFPPLRRVPTVAPLVEALAAQHVRGRQVTDRLIALAGQGPGAGAAATTELATLCESFVRMYRPHAAREDTVVFPALRAAVSRHELHELGERMEEAEHQSVGEGGFERAVGEVAELERSLGIDDVARFTAPAPASA
jgi:hemerythrin-like domain-containing protein